MKCFQMKDSIISYIDSECSDMNQQECHELADWPKHSQEEKCLENHLSVLQNIYTPGKHHQFSDLFLKQNKSVVSTHLTRVFFPANRIISSQNMGGSTESMYISDASKEPGDCD